MNHFISLRRHNGVSQLTRLIHITFLTAVFFLFAPGVQAAEITLAWDPNTEPDMAGYMIYYGPASGQYDYYQNVGNQTSYTVTGLDEGHYYYIALTAYDINGNQSDFSDEIRAYIPPDGAADTDHDGLIDDDETYVYGTDPNRADTDGDGINDGEERSYWGSNWNADYDGDGLTNLLDQDSDGDGYSDGAEREQGVDPGDATSTPSYDSDLNFQLKEHKVYSSYNPNVRFEKPSASVLRCVSTTGGLGNGYVFVSLPRSELDGMTVSLRWATSTTYSGMAFGAIVLDGAYDRMSEGDFPSGSNIAAKGAGVLQTIEWFKGSRSSHTVAARLELSRARNAIVTVMLYMNDAWGHQSGYFDIEHLRILDSSGNVVHELDTASPVAMERTGTLYDYGVVQVQ
jgi:hypothetical protein